MPNKLYAATLQRYHASSFKLLQLPANNFARTTQLGCQCLMGDVYPGAGFSLLEQVTCKATAESTKSNLLYQCDYTGKVCSKCLEHQGTKRIGLLYRLFERPGRN